MQISSTRALHLDDATIASLLDPADGAFDWADAIELRNVVAGNVSVPRAGNAPVLFETQGVALQDVAVAALAYRRHLETESDREESS